MKNYKSTYKKFSLLLILILCTMTLTACFQMNIKFYRNPSRSGSLEQDQINSGLSLKYKTKGGKILYASSTETYASVLGLSEQLQYDLYLYATKGNKISIDYTAFAPTIAPWVHTINEEEINVNYPTNILIEFSNFPDEEFNKSNVISIGDSGSSYSNKLEFTIPKGTVDAEVSLKVYCEDYFNRDGKTRKEYHAVAYIFNINPPSDEIATAYTKASQNGGDSLTSVPSTVVLGVMSTAAAGIAAAGAAATGAAGAAGAAAGAAATGAAGAAGAAAGAGGSAGAGGVTGDDTAAKGKKKREDGEDDEDSEDDDDDSGNSSFGMYISKDFGDTIRKGETEVSIYARMVEITADGREIDRPDLTKNISIKAGENIEVSGQMNDGAHAGALLSVDKNSQAESGTVLFVFTGEGGSFTNNVSFRIAGEATIDFPEQKSYSGHMFVDAIAGDGYSYEITFVLEGFVREAETIEFDYDSSELSVDFEKISTFYYKAIVENLSSPIEENVFAKARSLDIRVKAINKEEEAENSFVIYLHPEGISIDARVEDGMIMVSTIESKSGGPLDPSIKPTKLSVKLAVKTLDEKGKGQALISTEDIRLEDFVATSTETETLLSVFEYEINKDRAKDGIFFIEPGQSLPETKVQYLLKLPVKASYKGENYEAEVPLRLIGEKPERPEGWEEEYRKLRLSIQRYGLVNNGRAQELIRAAEHRTAFELSMIRRAVIEEGVEYYTKEAEYFMGIDSKLENIELMFNVIKWFGDQASSYLLTVYTGQAGEAFITPLKDYMLEFIGEAGAKYYWGEEVNFDSLAFVGSVTTGVENTIGNMMTGQETPTPKKLAGLVAALAILNFSKHYYTGKETKGEWFKSLVATGGDLTANAFKMLLGQKLESMLKNPTFKDQVDGWITNQVSSISEHLVSKEVLKSVTDYATELAVDFSNAEVVKKYLEEAFGLVGATIYESVVKREDGKSITTVTIPIGTSNLEFDIMNNISALVEMQFEVFNKIISFITSPAPALPDSPVYFA